MKNLVYLRNVATLHLHKDRCIDCGMCLTVCPHAVFAMSGGRMVVAELDACMECGACARNCPTNAVTVQPGVGCAMAVINSAIGRKGACCCTLEPADSAGEGHKTGCC